MVLDDEQLRTGVMVFEQTAQPMVTSDPPPHNPPTDQEAPMTNLATIVTPVV